MTDIPKASLAKTYPDALAESAPEAPRISGARRAAILLLSLDEDSAARIFRFFSDQEIERISQEMINLTQVNQQEVRLVLEEFRQDVEDASAVDLHSSDHLRAVLTKALGSERATGLIEEIVDSEREQPGIHTLNEMEPGMVGAMISTENPQIVAAILTQLKPQQAARILESLDEPRRSEVVMRIATFSDLQPIALQELNEVLSNMLEKQRQRPAGLGGARSAAEILNLMNSSQEAAIIESVRARNEVLAQRIIDEMFTFGDLIKLDDRSIQLLLREVDSSVLGVALKGAPQELIDRITGNMSQRAAQMLLEDMEVRGPMRLSQVESERQALLVIVKRLMDTGEIELSGGEEDYV